MAPVFTRYFSRSFFFQSQWHHLPGGGIGGIRDQTIAQGSENHKWRGAGGREPGTYGGGKCTGGGRRDTLGGGSREK